MVVADNEINGDKKCQMLAILMAMRIRRCDAGHIAQWSASVLHAKPLDATIGQVPAPYRPGGRHG